MPDDKTETTESTETDDTTSTETSGGAESTTKSTKSSGSASGKASETDTSDLQAQIDKLTADLDKWRSQARKNETRAKENADAVKEKQTVEEQLQQLQKDMADRDAAAVSEKAEIAGDRLHAKLVRGGLSDEDATTLVGTIDAFRLLDEGKPDTKEIDRLAKSLLKIGTRQAPDRDQGAKGGDAPPSMNQMIREAAKRTSVT